MRNYVTLSVHDEHLSPDEITAALGVRPTKTMVKGDNVTASKDSARAYANTWALGSRPSVDEALPLQSHMSWLAMQLTPAAREWLRERRQDRIWIYFALEGDNVMALLDQDNLAFLAALRVEVTWDIYP